MKDTAVSSDKYIAYIQIAMDIIDKEGIEALSIRRVAKEAGCTSAVLYRHFENKDHLLMMASVKYLRPYIQELIKLSELTDIDPLQADLILWKKFIDEAFHGHSFYDLMFFSEQKDILSECIHEYYKLFPDEQKLIDAHTAGIIVSSDLSEREMVRLRQASEAGLISMDNAMVLSRLAPAVFTGIFRQIPSKADDAEIERMADECFRLIYELFQRFAEPGALKEQP